MTGTVLPKSAGAICWKNGKDTETPAFTGRQAPPGRVPASESAAGFLVVDDIQRASILPPPPTIGTGT